jgi:hypothetical protein
VSAHNNVSGSKYTGYALLLAELLPCPLPCVRAEAERVYVDSAALAHVLRQRFETHKSGRAGRTHPDHLAKEPALLQEMHGSSGASEGSQTHTHVQVGILLCCACKLS